MNHVRPMARLAAFCLISTLATSLASAQYWGGYWSGRAATAEESRARGMADIIRSRGEAQQSAAIAARDLEEARRRYLENRDYAARSFVERRQLRQEYRESGLSSVYPDKEKLAAYVESRRLQPLTSSEFDNESGEIAWPLPLSLEEDREVREKVADLFRKRAQEGRLSGDESMQLSRMLRDWRDKVGQRRDDFSASDISYGARFLGRLETLVRGDFQ